MAQPAEGGVVETLVGYRLQAAPELALRRLFDAHAALACAAGGAGVTTLDEPGLARCLVSLGAKRDYCTQYFRAFDLNDDRRVDWTEFVLGLVAMDPTTFHGDAWGEQRSRYIFRTYDLNGDGMLDSTELQHLVRHLRRARGEPETAVAVRDEVALVLREHAHGPAQMVTLEAWLQAVGSKQIRGTSKLFRVANSVLVQGAEGAAAAAAGGSSSPLRAAPSAAPKSSFASPPRRAAAASDLTAIGGSSDTQLMPPPPSRTPKPAAAAGGGRQRASSLQVHIGGSAVKATQGADDGLGLSRVDSELHGPDAMNKIMGRSPSLGGESPLPGDRTAEALANRLIDQLILDDPTPWQRSEDFTNDVLSLAALRLLCRSTIAVLQAEPTLVEVRAPAKVFGDIHGQFSDLRKFFATYGSPNHRTGDINMANYVFIGDWVDRGASALEVVALLFALKTRYPSRVTLVRGNHEDRGINEVFGFKQECCERCQEDGPEFWRQVNNVFDWVPLGARIQEKVLCLHGGIGRELNTLDQIRAIKRPMKLHAGVIEPPPIVTDILWSDPTDSDHILGITDNPQRGGDMVKYGPDRVKQFCADNGLRLIIRAHECVQDGYQYFAACHLITIFSATNYCARYDNDGAFLEVFVDGSQLQIVPKVMKAKSHQEIADAQIHWRAVQHRPPSPLRGRRDSSQTADAEEMQSRFGRSLDFGGAGDE